MVTRAALYIRVSTEEQAEEGYSLEAQQERLTAYCEAQGWDVVDVYADRGYSGRKIGSRAEYKRMIDEKDRWDTILILKMDRIHRNSRNFIEMMDNLEKWGKKFTSMQEELDTSSAIGRFVVDMIQRIAQLESEQIGERTYVGMEQKASMGGMMGFNPPYGYRLENSELIIEEREAEIIRRIYLDYLQGNSMALIADSLNSESVFTKNGNLWTKWSISRILHNPIYAGYRRWDTLQIKSDHAPIISLEVFNNVQILASNNTKDPSKRKTKVLDDLN
jgi:site-specific recombinase for integration and excision